MPDRTFADPGHPGSHHGQRHEEKAVDLKREMVARQERAVWNPALAIPAKKHEFTDPEVARIKAAIHTWDS